MSFFLFTLFGVFEIYALFALIFKAFRLPYFEYIKEISIIAISVAIISYVIRVYLEINQAVDIVTHLILYILFFRFLIKARTWRSIIISFMYIGYGVLNIMVYFLLTSTNIVTAEVLSEPNSSAAYIIQGLTGLFAIAIALVIYRYNLGFSFIIRPPHDFLIKTKIRRFDFIVLVSIMIVFIMLLTSFYYIFHFKSLQSAPLIILPYILIVYLAYRRDMTR